MRNIIDDFSMTAVVAALLALIVSYAGSAVIIFQAAKLAGLSQEQMSSWIWAASIGSGITGVWLSWRMKAPVVTAWSTPGAALLVVVLPGLPFAEAIGAYMASAVIITIIGITGSLDAIMRRIPATVSSGMFAGILFSFGAKVFTSIQVEPVLVLVMLASFIAFRRISPRYSVMVVLIAGIAVSILSGNTVLSEVYFSLTMPVITKPVWSWTTFVSVALPLVLVNLTGQYISGMAVLHASGYPVSANRILSITGIFSLLLAPFGAHSINLASLTAAICTGAEAHEKPEKRYVAGIVLGGLYILAGLFGTTITLLFSSLPAIFIAVLAGLALISAFTTGLRGVVKDDATLEGGVIAFLATASGMELLGLGAPFWGLLLGGLTCFALGWRKAGSPHIS